MAVYRKLTNEEKEKINKHSEWVRGISTGVRADFSNADLSGVNFMGMNLTKAIFKGANLSESNLSHTTLSYCDFENANLDNCVCVRMTAYGSNMTKCSLKEVNFTDAFLKCSDLLFSDLTGSIFNHTDLTYAHIHNHHFMKSKFKNCYLDKTFFI